MSRGSILSISYISVAIFAILTYYGVEESLTVDYNNKFIVTYLPNVTGISVYEPINSNTMKSNLTTVNNIIHNMISKGNFYIEKDYSEKNILDILLTNGEEEYRILYNRRTRDFMTISNPFLKNYIPMTYIHE